MFIRIFTLLFLSLSLVNRINCDPIPGKTKSFISVKAHQGQGIYALLRSYKLLDKPGSIEWFCEINGLSKDDVLIKNHNYKLPVTEYHFDGTSIRSSVGIRNIEKAKEIENYNVSLSKSEVKKSNYKKDKKIWVPVTINDKSSELSSPKKKLKSGNKSAFQFVSNKEKSKKHFLMASMSDSKSEEVADHKMSDDEVDAESVEIKESISKSKSLASKVSNKSLSIPLFGDKYESVPVSSNELANEVFYIIPGHGGPDPGAIAKNIDGDHMICEDEYAYDVCLRLAKNLIEKGATVYVIVQDKDNGIRDEKYLECDCNEKCINGESLPLNQKKRLKQGMTYVNKLYAKHKKLGVKKQWTVTIHIDAQSEESRRDVFFYYQSESETSKNKALDIQKVFEEKYQTYRKDLEYTGTVTSRPLYVVRNSNPEPIYIELANIHNPEDRKRILFPKNRQLLADWITEGFLK